MDKLFAVYLAAIGAIYSDLESAQVLRGVLLPGLFSLCCLYLFGLLRGPLLAALFWLIYLSDFGTTMVFRGLVMPLLFWVSGLYFMLFTDDFLDDTEKTATATTGGGGSTRPHAPRSPRPDATAQARRAQYRVKEPPPRQRTRSTTGGGAQSRTGRAYNSQSPPRSGARDQRAETRRQHAEREARARQRAERFWQSRSEQRKYSEWYREQRNRTHEQQQRKSPPLDPLMADYTLLGTAPQASDDQLRKAYRRLMMRYHPDRVIARGASEQDVTAANEKTIEIRAAYDRICAARA